MILTRTLNRIPIYRWQSESTGLQNLVRTGDLAMRSAQHVDKFIFDCKEAGLWNLITSFWPFVGNNLTTAIIDAKGASNTTAVNFIAGDFTEAAGLTGNGSTKYLDLGFDGGTLSANDCHLSAYVRADNVQAGNRLLIGYGSATHHYWMGALTPASACDARLGQLVNASGGGQLVKGFYCASRNSSTSLNLYRNGASIATSNSATTGVPPNLNILGGAWNNNGTPAGHINTPLSFFSVGASMTSQQQAAYYTLVQTLQTNLGRAV
jgi:hypothetical protein